MAKYSDKYKLKLPSEQARPENATSYKLTIPDAPVGVDTQQLPGTYTATTKEQIDAMGALFADRKYVQPTRQPVKDPVKADIEQTQRQLHALKLQRDDANTRKKNSKWDEKERARMRINELDSQIDDLELDLQLKQTSDDELASMQRKKELEGILATPGAAFRSDYVDLLNEYRELENVSTKNVGKLTARKQYNEKKAEEEAATINKAVQELAWQQKYAGYSYAQIQQLLNSAPTSSTISSMPTAEERKWLEEYALSNDVLTVADYDKLIADKQNEIEAARSAAEEASRGFGVYGYEDSLPSYGKVANVANLEEELEALERNRERKSRDDNYKALANSVGFEGLSGYSEEAGKNDMLYAAINGDEEARNYLATASGQANMQGGVAGMTGGDVSGAGISASSAAELYEPYYLMNEEEVAIYNYIHARSKENAEKYLDHILPTLNERYTNQLNEQYAEYARQNPGGASFTSVLASPMKIVGAVSQAADLLDDGVIDTNSVGNRYSNMNSAIRGEVSDIVEKRWGKAGSFAYQTGMSMADFLANTAISGGDQTLALTLMASGAMADTVIDAKKRGLDDEEAFSLGIVSGVAEAAMEKVGLDALFGKLPWSKSAIGYFLTNALGEAAEEVGTEVINSIADTLIAQDKSLWQQSINAYISQGYTPEEAFAKAVGDKAGEIGLASLGGLLSGLAIGTPGAVYKGTTSSTTPTKANQDIAYEALTGQPSPTTQLTQPQPQSDTQNASDAKSQATPQNEQGFTSSSEALDVAANILTTPAPANSATEAPARLNPQVSNEETLRARSEGDIITSPATDGRLERAISMQNESATASEIFNATGLVVMANGNIADGFGGEIIWRPNDERRTRAEAEIGNARNFVGEKTGQPQAGVLGDDGRATDKLYEELSNKTPYGELTDEQKQGIAEAIINKIVEKGDEAAEALILAMGPDALAQEVYNSYLSGVPALEAAWTYFVDDTSSLVELFDSFQVSAEDVLWEDAIRTFGEKAHARMSDAINNLETSAVSATGSETDADADGNAETDAIDEMASNKKPSISDELTKSVKELVEGRVSVEKFADDYLAKVKDGVKDVHFSAKTAGVVDSLKLASERYANNPSEQNARKFRRLAVEAVERVCFDINYGETINKRRSAVKTSITRTTETTKSKKSKGFANALSRFLLTAQRNPTNVFKFLGGYRFFENDNPMYAYADKADNCTRKKHTETVAMHDFLVGSYENDGFSDFANNKTNGVKVGDVTLSMNQTLSLVKTLRTIVQSYGKGALNWVNGICVEINGENTFIKFNEGECKQLLELASYALDSTSRQFSNDTDGMFAYAGAKVGETYKAIEGVELDILSKNYFPIAYAKQDGSIEEFQIGTSMESAFDNMRSLQERTGANGDGFLLIRPATDVVDSYITQATNYLAYAEFGKELTYLNMGEQGIASLSSKVDNQLGSWMVDYIKDINQFRDASEPRKWYNEFVSKARSAFQQGALLFSVSVPIKQISSYWSSMGVLDPQAVLAAYRTKFVKAKGYGKNNSEIKSRALGNVDPSISEVLNSEKTWVGKLRKKSNVFRSLTNAINTMDLRTVDNLYTATIYDVYKSKNGSLPKRSQIQSLLNDSGFMAEVDDKFAEVVLNTQPIYDKNARAAYARTDNELIKALSMFRTQQTQNFNRILTAAGEYRAAKNTSHEALASKALKQTVTGQIIASISLSMLTSLSNVLLHKHKKYEDEEGKVDVSKVIGRLLKDSMFSAAGTVWFGDTIAKFAVDSIIELAGGESSEYYGINAGSISAISDCIDSIGQAIEAPTAANINYAASNIANTCGVPVRNVYSALSSVIMWSLDILGENPDDYDDVLKLIDSKVGGKADRQGYNNAVEMLLAGAIQTDEQKAVAAEKESIYNELGSVAGLYIREAPEEIEFDGETYILGDADQESYIKAAVEASDMLLADLYENELYKNADAELKQKMTKAVNDFGKSIGEKALLETIFSENEPKKRSEAMRREEYISEIERKESLSDLPAYIAVDYLYRSAIDSEDYGSIDDAVSAASEQNQDVRNMLKEKYPQLGDLQKAAARNINSELYFTTKRDANKNGGTVSMEELWEYFGIGHKKDDYTDAQKKVLWDLLTTGETSYFEYKEKHS